MEILLLLITCSILSTAEATCNRTACETCTGNSDNCDTCKSGYYLDGGKTCLECGSDCLNCSNFTTCTQCAGGYYKYFALDGNTYCTKCPADCATCIIDAKCTACNTGYYGVTCAHACEDYCVDGACSQTGCTIGCTDGYYKDSDDVCKNCLHSCETCSNSSTCNACKDAGNYGPECVKSCIDACADGTCDISTGRCAKTCTEGQYLDQNGQCLACSSSCKACEVDSDMCTNCYSGYGLSGGTCVPCGEGYYTINETGPCLECSFPCKACEVNSNTCTKCFDGYGLSRGQCIECKEGYYNIDEIGECLKCTSPCKTCADTSTTCTQCEFGYYLDNSKCRPCYIGCNGCTGSAVVCPSCKDGFYRWFQGCTACSAKCATCTSSTQCTACEEGYHLTSGKCCPSTCATCTTAGQCTACYSGYHLVSGECHRCISTCATCTSYSDCASCNMGRYLASNHQCPLCPSGCTTCTSFEHCTTCNQGLNLSSGKCCPSTCATCSASDKCVTCIQGHYLLSQQCHQCSSHCKNQHCDAGGSCINGCDSSGRFGRKCDQLCTDKILNCTVCNATENDVKCTSCEKGFVLVSNACKPCSTECKDQLCYPNGICINGCRSDDWYGLRCNMNCMLSFQNCSKCNTTATSATCVLCETGFRLESNHCVPNTTCGPQCKNGTCDEDGNCTNGCSSTDKYGPKCDKNCTDSFPNCSTCNTTDIHVHCTKCITGYRIVDNTCAPNISCSINCKDNECDADGNCTNGCSSRNQYGPKCDKSCKDTLEHCSECGTTGGPVTCSTCEAGYILHSGSCQMCPSNCNQGCVSDDDGITCRKDTTGPSVKEDHDTDTAAIGGAIGGCFILIALVVVLLIVVRKRHQKLSPEYEEHLSTISVSDPATDTAALYSKPIKRRGNVSMAIDGPMSSGDAPTVRLCTTSDISEERCTINNMASPAVQYSKAIKRKQNVSMAISGPVSPNKLPTVRLSTASERSVTGGHVIDNGTWQEQACSTPPVPVHSRTSDTYYNTAGLIRSRISVDQLQEYVNNRTRQDYTKEFLNLPDGLVRPYDAAMQNRSNNRYAKIYPYDASRVVLESGPTDYINASHIDCYSQYNTYIASLGPTDKTMPGYVSFWTMVWQERVEVIVMLTNLMEGTAMKCEQYWPAVGSSMTYGVVTVTCHSEDVYAEYTVRTFTVQQTEKRTLYHIHFTAWPDRGVPDDVTGLIEFRQRVISCPMKLGGPTVVHCSAGIGRTGTYIALDILTREGRVEGTVDVFGCVNALRGLRVNMVQTYEQYEYLHNALVHSLTFDCDPIQADTVQQLLTPSCISTIDAQFEHLSQTTDIMSEAEKTAVDGNRALAHKNRPGAEVPGNRHRPWIQVQQTGQSEYINAVFVNSFKQKDQYVCAQTPLPTTVTDFLALVMQTSCPCIVSLDEVNIHDETVGVYVPATNQVSQHGIYQVECVTCETTQRYTLRQLVITARGPGGVKEHSVYHFQCTSWGQDDSVPRDADVFLQLTKDVERVAAESRDAGPIIVHCLTGATRSALFCMVSILIQKMEIEHQVSVVNTVRQVKARRRTAIPNKEQYQFCHQCLEAYIQSFETFSSIPL